MESRNARPWAPRWIVVVFAWSVGALAFGCSSPVDPIANTPSSGGVLGDLFPGLPTWCAWEREAGVDAGAECADAGEMP